MDAKLSDQLPLMAVSWLARESTDIYCPAGPHGEALVARRLTAAGADHRGSHLQFERERDG